jgi:parallel beta-helix repeat protein
VDARPTLTENIFDNNGTWGILVYNGATPILKENSTENNGVGGMKERELDI